MPSAPKIDVIGNVGDHVDDFLVVVELQPFLREIAEAHCLANVKLPGIRWHDTQEHLDERGLAGAVVADNTHLLESRKVIVEVIQDHLLVALRVGEFLGDILALKDLRANIDVAGLEPHLPVLDALMSFGLQIVESLLTVARLVATGLWHAAHPLQLRAIEILCTRYLNSLIFNTFLPLL